MNVLGDYTIRNAATGCMVSVKVRKGIRSISSNGLPDYQPGVFPNSGNPNSISAQAYSFALPTNPKLTTITPFAIPQSFGITVDGVLFDPFAAEYWNNDRNSGWQYYALGGGVNLGLDKNNAHVQPSGAATTCTGSPLGFLTSLAPRYIHHLLVGPVMAFPSMYATVTRIRRRPARSGP